MTFVLNQENYEKTATASRQSELDCGALGVETGRGSGGNGSSHSQKAGK